MTYSYEDALYRLSDRIAKELNEYKDVEQYRGEDIVDMYFTPTDKADEYIISKELDLPDNILFDEILSKDENVSSFKIDGQQYVVKLRDLNKVNESKLTKIKTTKSSFLENYKRILPELDKNNMSESTVENLTDAQKGVLKPLIKGIRDLSKDNENVLKLLRSLEVALGLRRGKM